MTSIHIRELLSVVAAATSSSHIVVNGTTMQPLLPKTADELFSFWEQGLSAIALRGDEIVGHGAIEPLTADNWYEFGAVWVHPSVRGSVQPGNGSHPHVGLRLYRAILGHHREKNILATTINGAAMTVGWRANMKPVRYNQLPQHVWEATCCCPVQKTGVPRERNVGGCRMQGEMCFVRVTAETHERMGSPPLAELPVGKPTLGAVIPDDNIVILLAN